MAEEKTKTVNSKQKTENNKKVEKKISVKKTASVKKEVPQKVEKTENPAKASNDFAVIKTGGKQYLVTPGLKFNVEKIEGKEGDKVNFSEVLLKEVAGKLEIGEPLVKDSKVEGKIIEQTKGDKIVVLKYKKRKNYRRKQGHRQKLTRVEIVKI